MTGYWTQFAATGDPNGGTNPHWPIFAATADDVEGLVSAGARPFRTFAKDHHCGFWRRVPAAGHRLRIPRRKLQTGEGVRGR